MPQAAALLAIRAHTGIHAGVGQEVGIVDLPIQRERVTNFPTIRGPSTKGALRQAAEDAEMDKTLVKRIFGPETDKASEHAGSLSVADARLLLFPMRSIAGTFAWLTCPFALKRLQRDLADAGLEGLCKLDDPPRIGTGEKVYVAADSRVAFDAPQVGQRRDKMVVVEDYGFKVEPEPADRNRVDKLATQLKPLGLTEQEVKDRLAVVSDDHYQNFVSYCTEVVTRVHLDDETKTVRGGQLWTEELLPAESVLVALLLCADERETGKREKSGKHLLEELIKTVGRRLQLGGKETVGYGICHATWLGPVELPRTAAAKGGK